MERIQQAVKFLDLCMWLAKWQVSHNVGFYLEHPANASTWQCQQIRDLLQMPGWCVFVQIFCIVCDRGNRGSCHWSLKCCLVCSHLFTCLTSSVKSLYALTLLHVCFPQGVRTTTFDQCQFGLQSKVDRIPMRKRTTLLHNMPAIDKVFGGKICVGLHQHCNIQGQEARLHVCGRWGQMVTRSVCMEVGYGWMRSLS